MHALFRWNDSLLSFPKIVARGKGLESSTVWLDRFLLSVSFPKSSIKAYSFPSCCWISCSNGRVELCYWSTSSITSWLFRSLILFSNSSSVKILVVKIWKYLCYDCIPYLLLLSHIKLKSTFYIILQFRASYLLLSYYMQSIMISFWCDLTFRAISLKYQLLNDYYYYYWCCYWIFIVNFNMGNIIYVFHCCDITHYLLLWIVGMILMSFPIFFKLLNLKSINNRKIFSLNEMLLLHPNRSFNPLLLQFLWLIHSSPPPTKYKTMIFRWWLFKESCLIHDTQTSD